MSSPSQKHGSCGHIMASFDSHCFCARCREKGKGSDPCVTKKDCNSYNILSEEQRLQLSTPSYRLKKEKTDLKKSSDTPKQDSSSSSLIDPSSVTVVGAMDDQGILQSPGASSEKNKKPNPSEKTKTHSSKDSKPASDKPSKSLSKTHRSSPDTRIDELDQKWFDRFNRLEALLLAKSLDREPTFTTVKVTPAHSPPSGSAISSKPFIKPQDTELSATDLVSQRPDTDQPDFSCPSAIFSFAWCLSDCIQVDQQIVKSKGVCRPEFRCGWYRLSLVTTGTQQSIFSTGKENQCIFHGYRLRPV